MYLPFTNVEAFGNPPLSPGISELLADFAPGDTDDASCKMADDVQDKHLQPIQPESRTSYVQYTLNDISTLPTGPQQHQASKQPMAGLDSLAQPSNFLPPLELMDWSNHQPFYSTIVSADAERTEPTFVSGGLASQPGILQQRHGPVSAAAAGFRRGRKPMPRLPDLQQRLDTLMEQFQRLNDENTFLKGKLKFLESVLPYRDSHIGFLAAAKNGQIPRSHVQYLQKGGPPEVAAATALPPAPTAIAPAVIMTVTAPTLAATTSSGSFSSETSLSPPAVAVAGSNHRITSVAGLVAAAVPPLPSTVSGAVPQAIGSEAEIRAASTRFVTKQVPLPCLHSRHSRLAEVYAEPNATAATATVTEASVVAMAATTGGYASPSAAAVARAGIMPDDVASRAAAAGSGRLTHGSTCGAMGHTSASGSWSAAPPACLPEAAAVLALCPRPDGEVPEIIPAAMEELKRVSARDFQVLYKHCVMQLSVLGTAAEVHGPSSPQHVRLERFLGRTFVYMDQINLLSPNCFVQSMYVNVETGEPERPSDDFWRTLGLSLKLTPEQLEEVRMVMVMHEMSVAPVARERLKLASELSASISAAVCQPPVSSGDAIRSLTEVDEVTERLRRNVIKEYQAQVDVSDFLCMSVLTPIQLARIMAASYPYIPDVVAVLHACDPAGSNTQRIRKPE
ncbi:hypothetical protein VaNZ11_002617 [Volvox africanus]|uniref:Uncharacterized protein n=1 Tax=Volvox africanus TaxID=51714 RepID=A0ABQ5RSA7_9CHLO|nr:hypothetical protein VaNZ11_002617 [Volvox africanus]